MTRIGREGSTDLEQVVWLTVMIVVGMVVVTSFSVSMSRRDAVSTLVARIPGAKARHRAHAGPRASSRSWW